MAHLGDGEGRTAGGVGGVLTRPSRERGPHNLSGTINIHGSVRPGGVEHVRALPFASGFRDPEPRRNSTAHWGCITSYLRFLQPADKSRDPAPERRAETD
ncbi:hypothetical protein SKAU_G00162240 [Synaphobranchus kaupii]|uniref:Uncharacterized protein n=1 Tax=Synaphobranchus kaupii TaxID=118154 RepID=A0A9Q1IXS6_SYNKA|nr:hypothetical protein SKAU_G00162240 [Synaphobranchus kaupii]